MTSANQYFFAFISQLLQFLIMFLSLSDVQATGRVPEEKELEVYFQSDSRAAGMKDLVREFIRKATMVGVCGVCPAHVFVSMWKAYGLIRKMLVLDLVC